MEKSLVTNSLAALVVRQARMTLIEKHIITGITRLRGMPYGLENEDRLAMALVSKVCLVNGLPDYGAEIHDLLSRCATPLGEWLKIPEVTQQGLEDTVLINLEAGMPSQEAEELARNFGGLTASLEESLFGIFKEQLAKYTQASGDEYYSQMREFVVRHPVCSPETLRQGGAELPAQLWQLLQSFYEPVPESWQVGDQVVICGHCGNAMKPGKAGLVCRTQACAASNTPNPDGKARSTELMRVSRGIRLYWIEPGVDEIALFDRLKAMGQSPILYPFRDRVDISVVNIGMDLKAYSSPETLGRKLKRGIGGLSYYADKWLVIPDWLQDSSPTYLNRLRTVMDNPDVHCLTCSEVLDHFAEAGHA
jgi:hypothetical protein